MVRRPPISTRTDILFPTRRSSDLICSGSSLFRLNFKQRDSTVTGSFCGSVVASRNFTCGGGSSSVFSNALNAFFDSVRSEEHTSELQSLMRISYAVFFLKKNTYNESITSQQTDRYNYRIAQ